VTPVSRSQLYVGYGPDSGPSRGDTRRRAIRPIETIAICSAMTALDPGCVKTPERVHADLFCSLFSSPQMFRSGKIAENFALLGQPQKFAVFSHSLDRGRVKT
jgi:hypothetical protein